MSRQCFLRSARAAGLFGGWRAWLLSALLLFSGIALSACGGGGGSGTTASGDTGTVTIGLTDADGDFLSYTVDVTALTLTRADGAVVNALPVKTRVDFAQYTDLTEFLNAATVPSGVYTHVNLTLDYTNADIRVASGDNALAVTPRDSAGNPTTVMTLQVELDGNKPLVVRPGIPANLTLDFDLEATNTVDLNTATVTVPPVLIADVDLANPKPHRVRGPLLSVDQAASEFVVAIRPFHLLLGDFGPPTVRTDGNTTHEIDRVSYPAFFMARSNFGQSELSRFVLRRRQPNTASPLRSSTPPASGGYLIVYTTGHSAARVTVRSVSWARMVSAIGGE